MGLGNRVRAMLGIRAMARTQRWTFAYVWPTGSKFGATMDDLWEFEERTIAPSASKLLALRYPYLDLKTATLEQKLLGNRRIVQIRDGPRDHPARW